MRRQVYETSGAGQGNSCNRKNPDPLHVNIIYIF